MKQLGVFASFLLLASFSSFAQTQLRLGTQQLPPYTFTNEQGAPDGVAVNVVRCALDAANVPYEITFWPWARVQLMVRQDDLDGFFAASFSLERESYATLSAIIAPQEWRWYLLRDNPLDPASADFRAQARVSAYLGTNMLSWLQLNSFNVETAPATQGQLLELLKLKRVDAVLANNLVMEKILRDSAQQNIVRSVLQEDKPLGVYFSKQYLARNPDFLAGFNARIPGCREKIGDLSR